VSIATIAGYIISGFLPFGHGYWIMLTIIVIMKPVYSLTKNGISKDSWERWRRFVGLLSAVPDQGYDGAFLLMILQIGTYVFIRTLSYLRDADDAYCFCFSTCYIHTDSRSILFG